MKKLNICLISLILVLFGFSYAVSQYGPGMPSAEERAKRFAERLKSELKLDGNQSKKVQETILKYSKRVDSLRTKSKNREEMIESLKKIQTEQDNEIKTILTKEQFKSYQKIVEENRNRMRRRD